LIPRSQP